jgi:LAGLIDADG-like domain
MPAWTSTEISTIKKSWREKTDREIARLLDRSLYSVRSFRVRNIVRRRESLRERWKGDSGRNLSQLIATEYKRGSSQTDLVKKYRIEWRKLKHILVSNNLQIRDKSQQILVQRYGRLPRIRSRPSASKLYVIFAMLGDNLRPTDQTRWRTHIMGIAAGSDRDFARHWIENFEREYGVRPRLLNKGKNNIQAYISSVDIWRDLHRFAVFGSHKWRLKRGLMRFLTRRIRLRVLGYGLRGFFDAEGSFSHSLHKTSGRVVASSVNYRGLKQISRLLERLRIRHRFHRGYRNTVSIVGRASLEAYLELIGFSIRRKMERLEMTVGTMRGGRHDIA